MGNWIVENRGRKAVDVVVINTQHLRLKPPEYLNKHEAAIWSEVVNATDPQHALENDILGHRSNPSDMSAG